jgi:hypothetical protein
MKNKYLIFGMVLLALIAIPVVSATCTYSTETNSTDYFGISDSGVNVTTMSDVQLFSTYTFFTPRLNFTRNVTDSFLGGNTTVYSYIMWKTPINFSSSLVVMNGSTVLGSGNYSLRNLTGTQWVLDWTNNNYKGASINIYFNRTFIKNVDDIVIAPEEIYMGSVVADWLVQNTPAAYGTDKEFQFTTTSPGNMGPFVNVSNWAVGWSYTEKDCVDQGCSNPVNNTLFNVLATFFMIGMAIFIVFQLKNGADAKMIIGAAIAFLVMLIGLAILSGMISSICAV